MHIIIIGAGQTAAQTIISLNQSGFDGTITLIGDEPYPPYQRPPLSKKYLTSEMARDRLFFRPPEFYQTEHIEIRLKTRVDQINPSAKTITCADETLSYDRLILATGSRARQINIEGRETNHVFDLRNIDDIDRITPFCGAGKKLAIIGGGYIGLETAAACRQNSLEVTIIEAAPRILARVTKPVLSAFFMRLHAEEGVHILTDCTIDHITKNGVTLAGEKEIAADFIIMGVGIVPNIELAEEAGLAVDNGILVDEVGRTSDPHIYAGGDCTNHPNDLLGQRLRLESVPNAIEQAKAIASDISGAPQPYHQIPWFWSDQYDVKLQIAGLSQNADHHIIRGDIESRSFAIFHFADERLICIEAVNRPAEFMAGRQLIAHAYETGEKIDPAMLLDETVKPKQWLSACLL